MTKTRPIIFSGPMVRAILDGRKNQTRRIMKPQMPHRANFEGFYEGNAGFCLDLHDKGASCRVEEEVKCPYGKPGDRFIPAVEVPGYDVRCAADLHGRLWSKASGKWKLLKGSKSGNYLRNSLRLDGCDWTSRISLEITDVRVQRLQDISKDDAIAEGLSTVTDGMYHYYRIGEWISGSPGFASPIAAFSDLWNSINGPDAWDANPYVWALTFHKVETA